MTDTAIVICAICAMLVGIVWAFCWAAVRIGQRPKDPS